MNLFFHKQREKQKLNSIKNRNLQDDAESEFLNVEMENEDCVDFSCLLDKFRKRTFNNIPFLEETLEFRFQFIK